MANKSFLAPKINNIVESSDQIVKVNLESNEFGARKSTLSRIKIQNNMTLDHTGSKR